MANVNNVMYFDEMNILKADKDMRVRMCDKLEKELIDIFEWVSNFGIHFFYIKYNIWVIICYNSR